MEGRLGRLLLANAAGRGSPVICPATRPPRTRPDKAEDDGAELIPGRGKADGGGMKRYINGEENPEYILRGIVS